MKRVKNDKNVNYNLETLKNIHSVQLSFEDKKKYAKVVIDSSGSFEETQSQAKFHLDNLFKLLDVKH